MKVPSGLGPGCETAKGVASGTKEQYKNTNMFMFLLIAIPKTHQREHNGDSGAYKKRALYYFTELIMRGLSLHATNCYSRYEKGILIAAMRHRLH